MHKIRKGEEKRRKRKEEEEKHKEGGKTGIGMERGNEKEKVCVIDLLKLGFPEPPAY